MKDLGHQTDNDLELVILVGDKQPTVDHDHQASTIQVCEFCGHYPCGCGG